MTSTQVLKCNCSVHTILAAPLDNPLQCLQRSCPALHERFVRNKHPVGHWDAEMVSTDFSKLLDVLLCCPGGPVYAELSVSLSLSQSLAECVCIHTYMVRSVLSESLSWP